MTDKIDEDRGKIGEEEKDMTNEEEVEDRESGEEEQDNTRGEWEDREIGEETKDKRNEKKNDGMNVFNLINFNNLHAF